MSNWKSIVAALFLVGMFSFAFVYIYGLGEDKEAEQTNYYTYNQYTFVRSGALWQTQVQEPGTSTVYTVSTHYGPKDVEDVPMDGPLSKKFVNANYAFLSVDPPTDEDENRTQMGLAAAELSRILFVAVKRQTVAACTENRTEACTTRPIAPCAFEGEPVIYLKNEGEAAITFKGDCVEISGEGKELVKAVDRLVFYWLGIMRQRAGNLAFS